VILGFELRQASSPKHGRAIHQQQVADSSEVCFSWVPVILWPGRTRIVEKLWQNFFLGSFLMVGSQVGEGKSSKQECCLLFFCCWYDYICRFFVLGCECWQPLVLAVSWLQGLFTWSALDLEFSCCRGIWQILISSIRKHSRHSGLMTNWNLHGWTWNWLHSHKGDKARGNNNPVFFPGILDLQSTSKLANITRQ